MGVGTFILTASLVPKDVHKSVHTHVHTPGQSAVVDSAQNLSECARAVKAGEAEALDVSSAGPLRLRNPAVDTMDLAGPPGPAWMRLFPLCVTPLHSPGEPQPAGGAASHCQCKCVVPSMGDSSEVVETSQRSVSLRALGRSPNGRR